MSISNPLADPDERIPPSWRRLHEVFILLSRAWRQFGHLGPRGPEQGEPVLVIPGFVANDRTTMELRRALAEAGYRAYPWNGGFNTGARDDSIERLKARIDQISPDKPLVVIGWSLGGLFARELARAHPTRVRAVITLGTPFSGDAKLNNVWRLYELVAGHKVDDPPIPRITAKPPVPHLACWSRRDGIIAVRGARGLPEETDCTAELECSHMGFAVSGRAARKVVQEIDIFLKSLG